MYYVQVYVCMNMQGCIHGEYFESHYSHMCSTTLHDPILPHVQYHREYALACLATCAVPPNMHDLT